MSKKVKKIAGNVHHAGCRAYRATEAAMVAKWIAEVADQADGCCPEHLGALGMTNEMLRVQTRIVAELIEDAFDTIAEADEMAFRASEPAEHELAA